MQKMLCSAVALAGASFVSAAEGGVLWGVASYGPFSVQSLYRIDTATGAATVVGSTGVDQINGLAWDSGIGRMFAFTTDGELYTLNLTTGAAQFVAQIPGIFPEGDVVVTGGQFLGNNAGQWGVLDFGSGSFVPSPQPMGAAADDVSGLAVELTGGILGYSKNGAAEDTLIRIDPTTGVAATIGLTGISSSSAVGGMSFGEDGALYITDGVGLFGVNPATGAAALIGVHGVTGMSGLAIPTPGVMSLVGLAGLAGLRRKR